MYQVYCDSYLIFDTRKSDTLEILNPKVSLELNKTGSFTFTIYPSHPYYDKLHKLKSIIAVYQDDYLLFRGRILNNERGFYNEKRVTCEGELAFLVDSIQRPYNFMSGDLHTTVSELFTFFISNHNKQVEPEHQFKVGKITVKDSNNYIVRSDSTYLNTWDSIQKKLIEGFGGYLWVRHEQDGNYIDYLADFEELSDQKIEFGKNLLDISRITKGEDIATAIIPLGAKLNEETDERLTIKSVNDNVDYVFNQDAVDLYGWIFKTATWDDVTLPDNLLKKAEEALLNSINLSVSIELNAIDLALIKADVSTFRMGTYVNVFTAPHNLNANFLVTKLSLDLSNPKSNKLTLGKSYSTFTEQTLSASDKQSQESIQTNSTIRTLEKDSNDNFKKVYGILKISDISTDLQSPNSNIEIKLTDTESKVTAKNKDLMRITENGVSIYNLYAKSIALEKDEILTLENNWVSYNEEGETPSCYKDPFGIVHLNGLIKNGETAEGTVIATLASSFYPKKIQNFTVLSGQGVCIIRISQDGKIIILSGADTSVLSLSGISFKGKDEEL